MAAKQDSVLISASEFTSDVENSNFTVPTHLTKVYKDECIYCYHTPFFEGGLFVCLKTFYCFCNRHVVEFHKRTGNKLFVQIESKKVYVSMETDNRDDTDTGEPKDKITRLAINMDHGFDSQKFELEDSYHLVLLPNINTRTTVQEGLGPELFKTATYVVNAMSAERLEMLASASNAWDGEQRQITRHADLEQHNNGKKIPYIGWKCEAEGCDLSENLWLNLVDGAIRCGRSQFISEGTLSKGNNHMKQYFDSTGFPLVVKLGTILKDGTGDVYSYDEDDAVIDPNLIKHLAHFGLDVAQLEKTEKTTLEMELDMNQKWEWAKCQEDGVQLENIFGGGYTGLINIGSSCYMNSVVQALLTVPSFRKQYADSAEQFLLNADISKISTDFNAQMSKLFGCMMSGDYAIDGSDHNGISPKVFKRIIAGNHTEFSTARQQDAEEYVRFLFDKVSSHCNDSDPTSSFRFIMESRFEDLASGCVRYTDKDEYVLGVPVRKEHLTPHPDSENEGRFKTQLSRLLESELSPSLIEDFASPVTGERKGATNTAKFKSFPDFLLLAVQRFYFTENYTPKKYDVDVEVDDEIDLSAFRGQGKKDSESLLPEITDSPASSDAPAFNNSIVEQLEQMGFTRNAATKAAIQVNPAGNTESALEWLMGQLDDPTLNDEPVFTPRPKTDAAFAVQRPCVQELINFGFTAHQACYALEKHPDPNAAAEWLFEHADEVPPPQPDPPVKKSKELIDGDGKYRLVGLISHMGSSPQSGHYVVHLLKDGKWILFNDEKVAVSQNPPKQLAYLYLYQRI